MKFMFAAGIAGLLALSNFGTANQSLVSSSALGAEDWLQFRGPISEGSFDPAEWPSEWDEAKNIAWSTPIEGAGWSSPIVIGSEIFVTSSISDEVGQPKGFGAGVASMGQRRGSKGPENPVKFTLNCLDLETGEIKWSKLVAEKTPAAFFHASNTYATESPTSDGQQIYVYFAAVGVVACHNLDGSQVWIREFGSFATGNDFGTGSSLAIIDDLLFVQNDNEQESFLVALNTNTGEEVWRQDRSGRTCWSTPLVWHSKVGKQLVVCGSGDVVGLNPKTGEVNWRLTGMGGSFSSSPAADENRVYFGNSGPGSRGPLVAVNADAEGELEVGKDSPGIAWSKRNAGPGMASPVVQDGLVYVVSRGIIQCFDAEKGDEVYKSRLPSSDSVAASLIMDENRLLVLGESGNAAIIKPGRKFEVLAENEIPGLYWSTPATSGDSLLIRSAEKLICVRGESE